MQSIDDRYFRWLCRDLMTHSTYLNDDYTTLCDQMFRTRFEYLVPNDDNRAADGMLLRHQFVLEMNYEPDVEWLRMDCSFLEMLVALIDRATFQDDRPARVWFTEILCNLELDQCTDGAYYDYEYVSDVLERVNNRTYDFNGMGGMFPLKHPKYDQTGVELLYQMYAYVIETY